MSGVNGDSPPFVAATSIADVEPGSLDVIPKVNVEDPLCAGASPNVCVVGISKSV
jgi:hypothetical protein